MDGIFHFLGLICGLTLLAWICHSIVVLCDTIRHVLRSIDTTDERVAAIDERVTAIEDRQRPKPVS